MLIKENRSFSNRRPYVSLLTIMVITISCGIVLKFTTFLLDLACNNLQKKTEIMNYDNEFKVWLVCVIGFNSSHSLIPHYVDWYKNIGIKPEHMLLILHITDNDDLQKLNETQNYLNSVGVTNYDEWRERYSSETRHEKEKEYLKQVTTSTSDFIVMTDIDEFQNWKQEGIYDIYDFIKNTLIPSGREYVNGHFIDRFAENASLIDPISKLHKTNNGSGDLDLFKQYPYKCDFTKTIGWGYTTKVALFRNVYEIHDGHHWVLRRKYQSCCTTSYEYDKLDIEINHFKWNSKVLKYLQARIKQEKQDWKLYFMESQSMLTWLSVHSGKVDLNKVRRFNCLRDDHFTV